MKSQLAHYIPLLDFLSSILGKDTEIVLQDLTNGFDHSVVYIKNSLSGREVGSPATDFVLEVCQSKLYRKKDYMVNYKTKTISGKELHSSSFFIKNEQGALLGLICINSDKSQLMKLKYLFEASLAEINSNLVINEEDGTEKELTIVENFYLTAENLIEDVILKETQGREGRKFNLTRKDKIAIVRSLYNKGFFELKDSVSKVAEAFSMSEVSIYKYIQTIKKESD